MDVVLAALGTRHQPGPQRGKIVVGDVVPKVRPGHRVQPRRIETVNQEQQALGAPRREPSTIQGSKLHSPFHTGCFYQENAADASRCQFARRYQYAHASGRHAQSSGGLWHRQRRYLIHVVASIVEEAPASWPSPAPRHPPSSEPRN
jgi:hypothetical protein